MSTDDIHLYFRNKDTGRIITHFLYPLKDWEQIEMIARKENRSVDSFIGDTILDRIDINDKEKI